MQLIRKHKQTPEQIEKILRNRLESKLLKCRLIDETTGCWIYTRKGNHPYGRMYYKSKPYNVHRLSAFLYMGFDLDDPMQVNHRRECPNKYCFNPEHLYVGTQKENMDDRVSKLDTLPCGHPKVSLYTYTSLAGITYRWCRMCRTIARRNYYLEHHK